MSVAARAPVVVLACLEASDGASDVLRSGGLLAQAIGAELHLVRVVPPPVAPMSCGAEFVTTQAILVAALSEARAELEALVVAASRFTRGVVVPHATIGSPASEILMVAEMIEADVIVVGKGAKGAVNRLVLGSVSDRVAREARCSVVVARPKDYGAPQHVALSPEA